MKNNIGNSVCYKIILLFLTLATLSGCSLDININGLQQSQQSSTSLVQKLVGNAGTVRGWVNANMGYSSALSEDGNTLVVGAAGDLNFDSSPSTTTSGSILIFTKNGTSWSLQQKITGPGANGTQFGYSVAISGDTLVVGARKETYDETGANSLTDAGAAYVYTRSSGVWSLQQKLVGTGPNGRVAYDYFGYSVSISGETIVVGALGQDTDANGLNAISYAGAAFVFTRTSNVWSLEQKLVGSGTASRVSNDNFGISVAISANTIIVGAYLQDYNPTGTGFASNTGAAFVYTRSGGVWSFQQKLIASGTNGRVVDDYFGWRVAISGDTAVVGAPQQDYDEAGANLLTDAGAAYVFTRSAGVWGLQQKLVASGTNGRIAGDKFGSSLAISGDTVIIGSPYQDYDSNGATALTDSGAAYIFTRVSNEWGLEEKVVGGGTNGRKDGDNFGYSVAVSGNITAVGIPYQSYDQNGARYMEKAGAAVVADHTTGTWIRLADTSTHTSRAPGGNGNFAVSEALSEDGNTLVVGAPFDGFDQNNENYLFKAGAVYVFSKSGGSWVLQQKLVASGTNGRMSNDYFGFSVAISGNTIIASAPNQSYDENGANNLSQAGAAYIFTRSANSWTLQQKIVATGTNARLGLNLFGTSVSISNDTVVVGSYLNSYDENGANSVSVAGAAFVYTRSANIWTLQQKLVGTGTNGRVASDYFGYSTAIVGDTIAISAISQDYDENGANFAANAGAVYIFTRSANTWSVQQKLVATGTNGRIANDSFGTSIALSGDTIVVGSYTHSYDEAGDNSASYAGAAFVFTRSTNVWSFQQKLVPSGTNARFANDYFSYGLSISGDTIVVGAPGQSYDENGDNYTAKAGAAYLFTRTNNVWAQQQKVVGLGTQGRIADDLFGMSACIAGDTVVMAAPAQSYDESGENYNSAAGAIWAYSLQYFF